jgi:hypothetical protein
MVEIGCHHLDAGDLARPDSLGEGYTLHPDDRRKAILRHGVYSAMSGRPAIRHDGAAVESLPE